MEEMMAAKAKKKKKDAAAGIGSSKSKKGTKGKKGGAPVKAAPAKAADTPKVEVFMDRAEKLKVDTEQLFSYLKELRELKAGHIAMCLDVLRHCNNCEIG